MKKFERFMSMLMVAGVIALGFVMFKSNTIAARDLLSTSVSGNRFQYRVIKTSYPNIQYIEWGNTVEEIQVVNRSSYTINIDWVKKASSDTIRGVQYSTQAYVMDWTPNTTSDTVTMACRSNFMTIFIDTSTANAGAKNTANIEIRIQGKGQ